MKVKVSESKDQVLDYLVAYCEGEEVLISNGNVFIPDEDGVDEPYRYRPSSSYDDGERIIEREGIGIERDDQGIWFASYDLSEDCAVGATGPTPLIAAMRCYVANQLGDEGSVPNALFI